MKAVDGIDLHCERGEVLGIVGESGCGKTSLARCIVGLLSPSRGRIIFDGRDLSGGGLKWPLPLRRRIQIIFQNPENTLNPQHTVERCLSRPIVLFGLTTPGRRRDREL